MLPIASWSLFAHAMTRPATAVGAVLLNVNENCPSVVISFFWHTSYSPTYEHTSLEGDH